MPRSFRADTLPYCRTPGKFQEYESTESRAGEHSRAGRFNCRKFAHGHQFCFLCHNDSVPRVNASTIQYDTHDHQRKVIQLMRGDITHVPVDAIL